MASVARSVAATEVNEGFAKRPLNFFLLSPIGPHLILLFPFQNQ
jgi:hypothetical protein